MERTNCFLVAWSWFFPLHVILIYGTFPFLNSSDKLCAGDVKIWQCLKGSISTCVQITLEMNCTKKLETSMFVRNTAFLCFYKPYVTTICNILLSWNLAGSISTWCLFTIHIFTHNTPLSVVMLEVWIIFHYSIQMT